MQRHKEQLAEEYRLKEEADLASGNYEEVFVEEFMCAMCKKTFKKEGQLKNHLQSKKHKEMEAKMNKLKASLQLDDETEQMISATQAQKKEDELQEEIKKQEEKEERRANRASDEEDSSDGDEAVKVNVKNQAKEIEELDAEDLQDIDEWTHKAKKKDKKKKNEKNKGQKF